MLPPWPRIVSLLLDSTLLLLLPVLLVWLVLVRLRGGVFLGVFGSDFLAMVMFLVVVMVSDDGRVGGGDICYVGEIVG